MTETHPFITEQIKKVIIYNKYLIELARSDCIGKYWPLFCKFMDLACSLVHESVLIAFFACSFVKSSYTTFETDRVSVFSKIISYIAKLITGVKFVKVAK